MICNTIFKTIEENGFTFFKFGKESLAEIISCGGHDSENGDTGEIVSNNKIYL